MILLKIIKILVISLLTLAFSTATVAAQTFSTSCGDARFEVTKTNRGHPLDNKFSLTGRGADGSSKVLYESEVGGWFFVSCTKRNNGQPLLLFQEFCGGSVCVEDKYGAIDTSSLKIVLVPSKKNIGNWKDASRLLGRRAPHLPSDESAFCCEIRGKIAE